MTTVKDPVCGMSVESETASVSSQYKGHPYWFCSARCKEKFLADPGKYLEPAKSSATTKAHAHAHSMPVAAGVKAAAGEKAKDPICGMVVDKATALTTTRGERAYYFCSESCLRTFESPEAELKAMKTRVSIALTGVLALALIRAGAFIALAAGATILTWVPFDFLPWFTGGIW